MSRSVNSSRMPQPAVKVLQPMAAAASTRLPQPAVKVLQPKSAGASARLPQPAVKVLQPKSAGLTIQLGKKKMQQRYDNAKSNWSLVQKYVTHWAAQLVKRVRNTEDLGSDKLAVERICSLMVAWGHDSLTIGHASGKSGNNQNSNTDPAIKKIQAAFNDKYDL